MDSKPISKSLENLIRIDSLIVDPETNHVRFVGKRRHDLKVLFALAGININDIKTLDQYLAARKASEPYFMEWVCIQMHNPNPVNIEAKLLQAIISDNEKTFNGLLAILRSRKSPM